MSSAASTRISAEIRRWWRDDGVIAHAAKLGTGSAFSLGITLAATPLLTRLYSPDAFGGLGIFLAFLAIGTLVSSGRYEQAIALPASDTEASRLVALCKRLVVITSGAACLVLPFRHGIADQLGNPHFGIWLWALPICIWLAGQFQIASIWAVRGNKYSQLARARIAQALACVTLQLGFAATGELALLAGVACGQLAQFLWLRRTTSPRASETEAPAATLGRVAAEYWRFPSFLLPAALIDTLTFQIPALLGATWFGTGFVGLYLMATRLLSLPGGLAGSAFGPVFYQEFSRRSASPDAARKLLFNTWLKLAVIGGGPLLIVAYLGEPLFAHIFGSPWGAAGTIAVVMSPIFFAMFVSSPTSGALIVLRGQHLSPWFSLSFLSYRVAGFWVGAHQDDYLLGLAWVGVAEILTIAIYNGVILHRLPRGSA